VPEVILDRVAQVSTLESGASSVYSDDDILVVRGKVIMPVHAVPEVDLLGVWSTIPTGRRP
jgi:hypothetical protein